MWVLAGENPQLGMLNICPRCCILLIKTYGVVSHLHVGQYTLEASVVAYNGTQKAMLEVQVLPCPRGSVATGDNNTCITCVAGNPNWTRWLKPSSVHL